MSVNIYGLDFDRFNQQITAENINLNCRKLISVDNLSSCELMTLTTQYLHTSNEVIVFTAGGEGKLYYFSVNVSENEFSSTENIPRPEVKSLDNVLELNHIDNISFNGQLYLMIVGDDFCLNLFSILSD